MANLTADRVKETTTTTGTGTITLAGAVAQFRSFASAFADASVVQYAIVGQTGTEWEVGNGTIGASGTTLARTTVLASSNAGAAVNFSAGTKDVFATANAAELLTHVVGPASANDNAIFRYDGATGKLAQSSNVTCSDVSGVTTTLATITPEATTGATVPGQSLAINASPAVASTDTAGAAAGGSVTIMAGDAARLTSGNADGGSLILAAGNGIGTGKSGVVRPTGTFQIGSTTGIRFAQASTNGCYIGNGDGSLQAFRIQVSAPEEFRIDESGFVGWSSATVASASDTGLARSVAGVLKVTDGSSGIRALLGGGTAVASAAALPVPTGRVFHVTGTTNITSITSTNFQAGVAITMIFDGILTVTDGGNLKLAGNFVTAADSTLSLVFDGTNWFETGRSTN